MNSSAHQQVLAASRQWVDHFNRGDLATCLSTYTEDATMQVYPHGLFDGRTAIGEFWQAFVATAKPTNLEYRNVRVYLQNDNEAVLSATWSMNVGSGFISKELWVKQADGQWRLQQDDFSIVSVHQNARQQQDPQDTALVIVDFQNDYFDGGKMALHETAKASGQTTKLLEHFRSTDQPIIHVRHIFPDHNAPFFTPDSSGSEIHSSVSPQNGEPVVIKSAVNSFKDTELENVLIAKGIRKLVITGAMAQMCIDAIVRHASDAGYECTIVHDGCAAPALEWGGQVISAERVQATMMSAFEFAYGQVVSADDWIGAQ